MFPAQKLPTEEQFILKRKPALSDHACRNQNDQQQRYQSPKAEKKGLPLSGNHIRHIVGREEKRHIGRDKHRKHTPPLIYPDEGMITGSRKEGFEQREQQRHLQRADQLAADAALPVLCEIAFAAVVRQHLEGDDAGQGKHHGELPAYADEKDEGSRIV